MRVAILTNEFPPNVYGGAGVHVEYLTRELEKLCDRVQVFSFGDQSREEGRLAVEGVGLPNPLVPVDRRHASALNALSRNLDMVARMRDVDVVHCHTWYTHFAGILARQLHGIPLVLTTHSLEPSRPWKAEQLGDGGYRVSTWVEGTAYHEADGVVAVSEGMKCDVMRCYGVPEEKVRVVYNGIDPAQYRPEVDPAVLAKYGIDSSRPYVLFVGRITPQKGILHLLRAVRHLPQGTQLVLCASSPDTPEMLADTAGAVDAIRRGGGDVVWIRDMVPKAQVVSLYAGARVFCCPSIYEPFGIINLEAMSCGTPVVASAVGGIVEVVREGETGRLVPFDPVSSQNFEPADPEGFAQRLAERLQEFLADGALATRMGQAARRRVEETFSWTSIARQTLEFYQHVKDNFRI